MPDWRNRALDTPGTHSLNRDKTLASNICFSAALASACAVFAVQAASAQDARQQAVDSQLSVLRTTTYGLGVDDHCQVFDEAQRGAVEHLQTVMRKSLISAFNSDTVMTEQDRISAIAKDAWTGCLSRSEHADKWQLVDGARLYGEALLAAAGAMPSHITECAVGQDGAVLKRDAMDALRAEVLARYQGDELEQLNGLVATMSPAMAAQCDAYGYATDLEPAYWWNNRKQLQPQTPGGQPTSLSIYGPWTSFNFFSFEGFSEFAVLAYRTGGEGTGRLAGVTLETGNAPNGDGTLYALTDGTLSARVSGAVAGFEIRAEGSDESFSFSKTAQSSDNGFIEETRFTLDADATASVLALPDETPLTFHFQLEPDSDWRQYVNHGERPGTLPASRLKEAIDWASVPVAG